MRWSRAVLDLLTPPHVLICTRQKAGYEAPPKSPPVRNRHPRQILPSLILLFLLCTVPASAAIPVANFSGTPLSGSFPLNVSFTDSSTNSPAGWAWFFGDEQYDQPWTEVNVSAGWTQRIGHSSLVLNDGTILLTGGADAVGSQNDTWKSADDGYTWTQVTASSGWIPRRYHTTLLMPDNSIVLMGGRDSDDNLKNDVWKSTDSGSHWSLVTSGASWTARECFGAVVISNGSIILTGGNDGTLTNDTWISSDSGATWSLVSTSSGWPKRASHTVLNMPGNRIVLMGGEADPTGYSNDIWQSSDYGATWSRIVANAPWTARYQASGVVMPDGNIILMGGEDSSGFLNDVWKSADEGATWLLVNASAGWSARTQHRAGVMPDGSIVLTGGYNGGLLNDTWRFQPAGSSLQNPVHSYTTAGNYSVALQTYNAGGWNSTRKLLYINVTSVSAPIASFTSNTTSGTAPLIVQFNDTSTNLPTSWYWDFGDGTPVSTLQNPVHAFSFAGTYRVYLNVTNAGGNSQESHPVFVDFAKVAMFRGNRSHTGLFDDNGIHPTANLKWKISTGAAVGSSPVIAKDILYIGSNDGKIYAVNASNGWPIWNLSIGGANIESTPAVADDIVYIGSWDKNVYARDAMTGGSVWTYTTGDYITSSPAVKNGIVYIGSNDGKIYALNATSGIPFWTFDTLSTVGSSPAVVNDIVYVGSGTSAMNALNATTGTVVWRNTTLAGQVLSSPAVANGTVYFGSYNNKAYAMDAATGSPRWEFTTSGNVDSSPAASGDVIYFGCDDKNFYALGATNGTKLWNFVTGDVIKSSPAVANGRVYIGSSDTTLYVLDSITGTEIFRYTSGGSIRSSPWVDNETVFFGNENGEVFALGGSSSVPVVSFTANVTSGTAPLAVQFNDTSTNSPTAWNWSFGDGNFSTLQNPVYTYAPTGNFTVSLNTTNTAGSNTSTKAGFMKISSVQANFTWACNSTVPYRVDFHNTTTSNFLPLGSFWWYFGDGAVDMPEEPNPQHTYTGIGPYEVQLEVWDAVNGYSTVNKTVIPCPGSSAPVASFIADSTSGTAPLAIQFNDTSTNTPTSWNWAFRNITGNNTQVWWSTVQNATHTFGAGNFSISLNASNSAGYNVSTQVTFINVTSPVPTANGTIINQTATIFIGEDGLNVTHALNQAQASSDINGIPSLVTIGWWSTESNVGVTAPTWTSNLAARYKSLTVAPADFVSHTGKWYLLQADGITPANYTEVFTVQDPSLDIRIWDFDHTSDVTGSSVPQGTRLGFRIDTNMNQIISNRSPLNYATDGFIDISVKNTSGVTFTTLYNDSTSAGSRAGPHTILTNFVNTQPFYWGSPSGYSWDTSARDSGAYLYPEGTYTVTAESTLNHMVDNYRTGGGAVYTGKTVSPSYTISIGAATAPVVSYTKDSTEGTVPFAVAFTDTSAGSPISWNWSFSDGNYSSVQNPVYTFALPKVHNVTLTATFSSGLTNSTMQQVTGYAKEVTTTSAVNGTTSSIEDGNQTLVVNTTALTDSGGSVTSSTDTTITITGGNSFWQTTQLYAANVSVDTTAGNYTVTNVTQVVMQSTPITAALNESVGDISVSLDVALKQYVPDADVNITITEGATTETVHAFQLAAQNASKSISDIAYTIHLTNTESINTNLTQNATRSSNAVVLNMSVNHTWVERFDTGSNNGGRDAISIIRYPESGDPKALTTRFIIYNESSNLDWFEADSPDGLSIFGMVGYAAQQAAAAAPPPAYSAPNAQSNANSAASDSGPASKSNAAAKNPEMNAPLAPATLLTTTAQLSTDKSGTLSQSVQVQATDQIAMLSLPQGILATTSAGQPLTQVSINSLDTTTVPQTDASPQFSFTGLAYQCIPDGARFSPAISITFTLTEAQWNNLYANNHEPVIRTYSTVTNSWASLATTTDPAQFTISAPVTHFSDFAVFTQPTRSKSSPAVTASTLAAQPPAAVSPQAKPKPPSNAIEIMISLGSWCLDFITKNLILAIAGTILLVLGYAGWSRYRRKKQHDFIMYGRR